MASTIYEIDPNADTVIILRSPMDGEYFARWDDSAFDNLEVLDQLPFSMNEYVEVLDANDTEVHQASAEDVVPIVPEGFVLYYVSSCHLMMYSPVFKAALSPETWGEGHKKTDGRYYITADDWEEEVFLLLMNMLHLRCLEIPRTLSLELMAKIGILVDYYDCVDAVKFFTTTWMGPIRDECVPRAYCREVVLNIWVSYVFGDEDLFLVATQTAITYCDESTLRTLDLPISSTVSDAIQHQRCELIEQRIFLLSKQLRRYRDNYRKPKMWEQGLSRKDNRILFKCLDEDMKAIDLLPSPPKHPYHGFSLEQLNNCPRRETIQRHWRLDADDKLPSSAQLPEVDADGLELEKFRTDNGG